MSVNPANAIMQHSDDVEHQLTDVLDRLFAAALRLTRNRDDAEDLVPEAVTMASQNRDSLRDPASFRGWIFRILTNTFISDCGKSATARKPASRGRQRTRGRLQAGRPPAPTAAVVWGARPEQAFLMSCARTWPGHWTNSPSNTGWSCCWPMRRDSATRKSPRSWISRRVSSGPGLREPARACSNHCGNMPSTPASPPNRPTGYGVTAHEQAELNQL